MVGLKASIISSLLILILIVAYVMFIYQQTGFQKPRLICEESYLVYSFTIVRKGSKDFHTSSQIIAGQLSIKVISIEEDIVTVRYTISSKGFAESYVLKVNVSENIAYDFQEKKLGLWIYWVNIQNIHQIFKDYPVTCNITLQYMPVSTAGGTLEKHLVIQCSQNNAVLFYDYKTSILLKAHNYSENILRVHGVADICNLELVETNIEV